MGCNTSKESVQPTAEEAKEDVKNGDIPKAAEDSPTKADSEETSKKSEQQSEAQNEEETDAKVSEKDKEEAATRIQAAFRGHHARKSMKETDTTSKQTEDNSEPVPTQEQLQEEFRADDKELCDAATKIQASFRGHMSRKEQTTSAIAKTAGNIVGNVAAKIEEKVDDAVNELEGIDLTDPDLHKAATRIQASFRGHKVRQEVGVVPGSEIETKK